MAETPVVLPPRHPVPDWRPMVTVNAAMSLDGKIAGLGGRTYRFSDPADVVRVQRMRAEHDAILVGIGTVLADDPALVIKREFLPEGDDPVRVVLDSSHRTPLTARVTSEGVPTVLYCIEEDAKTPRTVRSMHGVEVVGCPPDDRGRVALDAVLADLKGRGLRSLMVEGGTRVLTSFLGEGLVDRASFFIAPCVMGAGAPALVDAGARPEGHPLSAWHVVASEARDSGVTVHVAPDAVPR